MHIDTFDRFIDIITEEEMKQFGTQNISFSYAKTSRQRNDIHANYFYFETQNDFLIEFFVSIRIINKQCFRISMDMNIITMIEHFLLDEEKLTVYKKDVEPILLFLERKKEEIEESIKNDHSLRMFRLFNEQKIQIKNLALETYNRLKNEAE